MGNNTDNSISNAMYSLKVDRKGRGQTGVGWGGWGWGWGGVGRKIRPGWQRRRHGEGSKVMDLQLLLAKSSPPPFLSCLQLPGPARTGAHKSTHINSLLLTSICSQKVGTSRQAYTEHFSQNPDSQR